MAGAFVQNFLSSLHHGQEILSMFLGIPKTWFPFDVNKQFLLFRAIETVKSSLTNEERPVQINPVRVQNEFNSTMSMFHKQF